MNQLFNPTFRNIGRGQLGGSFDILRAEVPTVFFPQTAAQPSYQTPTYSSYQTPTFQPQQPSGGTLKADNIFNSSVGLISQALSSFGRNPSTQITGSSSVQAIVQPQSAYGTAGTVNYEQQALIAQQQAAAAAAAANNGAGANAYKAGTGILDSLAASFNVSTTTLLIGLGLGAILLFKKPPSRR